MNYLNICNFLNMYSHTLIEFIAILAVSGWLIFWFTKTTRLAGGFREPKKELPRKGAVQYTPNQSTL